MRGRPGALLAALAVASTLVAASAVPAVAATGRSVATGVFSISPGDHELFAAPGTALPPTVVGNTTGLRLPVKVVPVLLHQSRSGAFTYGTSPAQLRAARRVLAVSTTGFTLGGDARTTVLEQWRPGGAHHAVYAGVIFRALVPGADHGVRTIEQLLGLDLLGVHGSPPARGRTTAVSVADGSAHRLSLTVSLKDVGGSFGTPGSVGVLIRGANGRSVTRVRMTPGVILPGVTRDFVAELPVRLRRGRYTAVASAGLGTGTSRRTVHFTVTADGLLPAPSLVPGDVTARGTVGDAARVTVAVSNRGTRSGSPTATVSLYPILHGVAVRTPVATRPLRGSQLAPGHTETEHLTIGRLRHGPYEVVVTYATPFAPTEPTIVPFTPRPSTALLTAVTRWVTGNLALLVVALLALIAGGYATRRIHRAESRPRIRLRPLP